MKYILYFYGRGGTSNGVGINSEEYQILWPDSLQRKTFLGNLSLLRNDWYDWAELPQDYLKRVLYFLPS